MQDKVELVDTRMIMPLIAGDPLKLTIATMPAHVVFASAAPAVESRLVRLAPGVLIGTM
jgi:hypothetical protein